MRHPSRLILLAVVSACLAACAGRPTASIPREGLPPAQVEERPEPIAPGVKPLTVEQEEMIAQ
jgi:hypothetical protein